MAVYTEVNEAELAGFLADYDLGQVLALKGIAEGVENSNFILHVESGYFILTLYEKRVDERDLPFFLGLMEHLADHGLTCPQPVRNRHGRALGRLAGRPAAVVTFLEGMWDNRPSVRRCAAVGEALGKLHQAGASFAGSRANALGIEAWPVLFEEARARAGEIQPDLAEEIEKELAFLAGKWPRDLPRGVIHADLFPDNVLFVGDELSGLIDFYFACTDELAYDAAICVNAWCFEPDGSFNIGKGLAFFGAYESVRKLDADEIEALPVLVRGAALRFALTRLVDWLNVPSDALVHPKNPLEYFGKLRFHQQINNARELGLLR
ncbi:homoserine kinase [Methylocapsa sp. D3K7]|uniref:homoserine kinase n=1 Tax=Methylocapsa sp. D3K7 TaxID=3041435 RepID=UPI00244E7A5F|nr:homoserine kinase [Methylocapsa sp. D3K7]WGJ14052.1 homoserine kinase [Methylocapsa sp. D3K7]